MREMESNSSKPLIPAWAAWACLVSCSVEFPYLPLHIETSHGLCPDSWASWSEKAKPLVTSVDIVQVPYPIFIT